MPVVGEDGLDELIYLIKHDDYELQTQIDAKQATLTGAATTIASSNLTASRVLISNASGKVAVSAVTSTELRYLDGVTSAIQDQLDAKLPLAGGTMTGSLNVPGVRLDADSSNMCWLNAKTTNRNAQVLRVYGGTDANGDAVVIGDGGLIIIGGGESAVNLYTALGLTPGTEAAYLAADSAVHIVPNCQTIANRLDWTFTTDSLLTGPNGASFQCSGTNGEAHILSGTNSSGNRMQLMVGGNNSVPYFRVYDGSTSSWGSWQTWSLSGHTHNYLPLAGGTLTGALTASNVNLIVKDTNVTSNTNPSANVYGEGLILRDNADYSFFNLRSWFLTNGNQGVQLEVHRVVDGTTVNNNINLGIDASGNRVVQVNAAPQWRSALGLGTSGAFPITIAQGGTGLTSSPSMLTNLASTTAANVLAASPRPGVTGTLPLGNGGTGATTAAGAKTNIGLDWLLLYSSTNGTNGTVTLTSTCISSTRTMKVFFKDNNNKYAGCLDVPYPTGSMTFPIYAIEPAANGSTLIRRTLYTINAAGNTLTPSYGGYIQIATSATSGTANTMTVTGTANGTNYLKIFRVYLVPM